jgi:acetoin utilization deacetylase AcuC-like enzyme
VEHDTGPSHPERPDRIRAIHRAVRLAGLIESPDPFPDFEIEFGPNLAHSPRKILDLQAEPAAESWLKSVHTLPMIHKVKRACEHHAVLDQSDTPTCPASFEIAMLSVGSALRACDFVLEQPGRRAFSAARPPGHHAEMARSMGFCLFNNAAIAARYLQRQYAIERVAIVDFDVHHGNGTQDCFEDDNTVLYISIHEDPRVIYPGTGYEYEVGHDIGRGFTLNVSMPPTSGDDAYAYAFDTKIIPKLDHFKPQALIISAGFDAHMDDPLAHIELSDDAYDMMTRKLVGVANVYCNGQIISILEGGYNLRALGRSAVKHIMAMMP